MRPQPRRKKWSEAEERSLIDKYGEMSRDGTLSKMKTREKKYKPIAAHVNAGHHARDPSSYPWQWTWKDVSTKIQNMRHQYSLVKQKIKKPGDSEEFDWPDGTTHWSNFILYKDVFGDVPLVFPSEPEPEPYNNELLVGSDFVDLEFDYEEEYNNNNNNKDKNEEFTEEPNQTRKRKKGWEFVSAQLGRLTELEARLERREVERESERRRRVREREEMARESEEREMMRREEVLVREREWEERMERKREEWKKRMDEMLSRHRAEMGQMQARLLHEQQTLVGQFIGLVSQWAGGLTDHHTADPRAPVYLSQMMVHGDARVEGDNQEDQFIVDG
ncbi:P-loop nucleoside triphosphate hydrolasessuperfamily protein with CH (Calponin Homology) domain [Striga asiatica]|uniref:P-loop nucleoside triphosphate hydrolasessuperfamily protein with CH (Calponin Homology) domain n=1 Tax=Striga asiatica TaxID=4170 RepID=A0A5A7Q8Y4_STRAF|nr:P-loop nucleoside triphosphate hydrolasessuperfamily protein with CH (Calponin Homology) domain [Striga asiatica]